ncbi:trifunctional purine biosynthetic protein adenosine-3-like [Rhinatrema bivittatum]|uniref:trifunctional purine biosynthetic protein adenosine-3-like n=1 Tax=Rhinatrema bivittatum TaxID=194408 RepID=UPI001128EB33|nr:trifunctional purine biosynthetic protein adenosine-3-like [Rhinatrema bivittatum]
MADRVLVIGSGGREHALAWKLAASPRVKHVFVAPGNAGTASLGKISNSAVLVSNHTILTQFCKDHNIGMVVVGPEAPLAAGLVDDLTSAGVRCFGPTAKASQLEASKSFAKDFMDRHGIPTAQWKAFSNPHEACSFITCADFPALVVKANGLTAGKGQSVAEDKDGACRAVQILMQDKKVGCAAQTFLVEERLEGEELACLCFSDGITAALMPPVQDHEPCLEGCLGGIGAYCPVPQVPKALLEKIHSSILQQAIDGMRQEGSPYVGVLYAGLMLTKDGPKVLKFKCCFGEPACQVILPLLKNDFYDVICAIVDCRLCSCMPVWLENRAAIAVVMMSGKHPEGNTKGQEITGISQAEELGLLVFRGRTALKDGKVVTYGGRVLTVTAINNDLTSALEEANKGIAAIHYPGAMFRKDIGYRAAACLKQSRCLQYKISSEDRAVSNIITPTLKPLLPAGCHAKLGRPVSLFDLKAAGYRDPILVSTMNNVREQLKIAQMCGKHDTIGQDLVAMCVNDILAQGAEPLFFLDYFACGKLDVDVSEAVVAGIAEACKVAECALLGGETAEMPGMYSTGEYDLSGFAVGMVERGHVLPQLERIRDGDMVIGIASSGLHSNGFSLVRKILEKSSLTYSFPDPSSGGHQTLDELLLTPAKIYSKALLAVLRSGHVKAYAHISRGGLLENIPRALPESLAVTLDAHSWKIPGVFSWLQNEGALSEEEMAWTFNCGIGAILVVEKEAAEQVLRAVQRQEEAWLIGTVVPRQKGSPSVEICNLLNVLQANGSQAVRKAAATDNHLPDRTQESRVRVAVLTSSGTGRNLEALIVSTREPGSCAQVALVISNELRAQELQRAARAGVPSRVIDHKLYGSRSEFESTIHKILEDFSIELICLVGFKRILSSFFLQKWKGKILNVHPSLLPSFRGRNTHQQVLQAGVRLTGCTVQFLLAEASSEAILVQEAVPVEVGDTEEALAERVREAEQRALPRAVHLVASRAVHLGKKDTVFWNGGS